MYEQLKLELAKQIRLKYSVQQMIESCSSIVTPRFINLYLPSLILRHDEMDDDLRSNWGKLLSDVDKNRGQLSDIIDSSFGVYSGDNRELIENNTEVVYTVNGGKMLIPKDCVMIWAGTPNNTELKKLGRLLEERLSKYNYEIKIVTGDVTSNKEIEKTIKRLIQQLKMQGKKLVILTRQMAARSVSVSEVDVEFLWYDKGGIEATTQRISRVFTNGKKWDGTPKEFGTVISFSFDPNREESGPIDEYIINEAAGVDGNEEYIDSVKRILNSAYIFKKDENGLIMEFTYDEKESYGSRLVNSSSLLKVAAANINIGEIDINDRDLDSVILDDKVKNELDRFSKEIKESVGGKDRKPNSPKENPEEVTRRRTVLEILKAIIKNVIEINEINNCESDNFEEILDMIYQNGWDDEVIYEVGVSTQTIKKWLKALPMKQINTIITQYNISQRNMVKDLEY